MPYVLISLALLAFIYARWLEPRWPRVSKIDIPIPGLEPSLDGFTILHLSDLHQAQFGPGQRRLLAAIEGQKNPVSIYPDGTMIWLR